MAVRLEFINLLIPIKNIDAHYPGGFKKFCEDNRDLLGGRLWHDEHLLRDGAMNPKDMEALIGYWKELGLVPFAQVDDKQHWKDMCVIEELAGGATLPCAWITVDTADRIAYISNLPRGRSIGRDEMARAVKPPTENSDFAQTLFNEFVVWYTNLVKTHGQIPRALTGVSEDGAQFILILDGLGLNHVERHKFIKFVLESERSIAYAYGSLNMSTTDIEDQLEEVLDIIVADAQHYVAGTWRVVRDDAGRATELKQKGSYEGDDPGQYPGPPGTWYLRGSRNWSRSEAKELAEVWSRAREKALFRHRNEMASDS
jgi:hypothetical protein